MRPNFTVCWITLSLEGISKSNIYVCKISNSKIQNCSKVSKIKYLLLHETYTLVKAKSKLSLVQNHIWVPIFKPSLVLLTLLWNRRAEVPNPEIAVAQVTYVIYVLSLWRKQNDLNYQRHELSPLFILSVCCKTIVCSNRDWSAGLLGTIYFERDPNSLFVCCTILKEAISGLEICVIKFQSVVA